MNDSGSNAERRAVRILVALSTEPGPQLPLDLYRSLLGDTRPEIVGLFVEEPRWFAHAGSKLAREIVLSGLERRLDAQALERQLRAQRTALRRLFEAEGARLGLAPAFETVREERRAALAKAAERADALIVDRTAAADALAIWSALPAPAALKALIFAPFRWPAGGDVAVYLEVDTLESPAGSRVLDTALQLARRIGAPLSVLIAGAGAEYQRDGIEQRARRAGVPLADFVPLRAASLSALADLAQHARVLIVPARSDAAAVAPLLRRLRGGLMLWRDDSPAIG